MQAFELAGYHWERTFLYLDFEGELTLSPTDTIVLKGMRCDPNFDAKPVRVTIPMAACHVESANCMRVRFLLGDKGNPVRSGDYQLWVRHTGDEYPIAAEEQKVHPLPTSNRRNDVLLYTKTSSYYEVIPFVFEGALYCTVDSKGMPEKFGYQAKKRLESARKSHLRAVINYGAVWTFDFFRDHLKVNPNKVLFTSDSRIDLSGNMEPLYERMAQRGLCDECKVVFAFKDAKTGVQESRTPLSYLRLSYHLATSRVVFCDDYQSYLYHLKYPKGTRLVQLWHACGHFKTVGWGRIGTLDAIAPFTNDHRNYTDVIVASESDVPIYGEAFGVLEECVKPLGIPRHDWLVDGEWQRARRERFSELFPQAAGKRVIVFAPTFRGAGKATARYDFDKIDYEALAGFCREHGFFFIFKMHPFIPEAPELPQGSEDVFADASHVREINDLLPSTDILVTDYSSVVYEAALLDIPTLYYAYDLEDYISSRSFYEPFEQFVSGKIVRTFDGLLDAIATGDFGSDRLAEFRGKNFKYLDGGACDRIIDQIVIPALEFVDRPFCADDVRVIDLSKDAAAINAELAQTAEPFVMFVDGGAKYGDDYVEGVLSAFADDPSLGVATGLVLNHAGKPLANEADTSDKTIKHDAAKRFSKCLILPYGAIYRTQVIRDNGLAFDEGLAYCRDELFAVRYMECAPTSARVNRFTYKTAKVLDETGPKTPQSYDEDWYFDSAVRLLDKMKSASAGAGVTRIAQYALLYLTIQRFKSNQGGLMKMAFSTPERTEEYLAQVGEVMRHIDDDVLFCRARAVTWERYKKIYLASLRNPGVPPQFEIRKGFAVPSERSAIQITDAYLHLAGSSSNAEVCRMGELAISVVSMQQAVDAQGRCGLDIRLRIARCFPIGSYSLIVRSEWGGEAREIEAVWETMVGGIVTFFDHYACRQDIYHAFVPLAPAGASQQIGLAAQFDGYRVTKDIGFAKASWANKLTANDQYGYWYFDGRIARSRGGVIEIAPATDEDRVQAELAYQRRLEELAEQAEARASAKPKSKKLKKDAANARRIADLRRRYWETLDEFAGRTIWAYYDKSYKAGDNAEYALRYAAAQDDGIEKVFFIDPACADAERLRGEGYTVLDPASIEGELFALHASIVHMTHVPAFLKLGIGPSRIAYFRDLLDAKVVRMYHGYPITRSASYAQVADNCAGVVVATGYERDLYANDDNGYLAHQIIESGMPRYDDLVDDSRRQILFAPTWRPALVGKSLGGGVSAYNPAFKESAYYRLYTRVLSDERLLAACREHGYKIKMFLHPKMNAQVADFEGNDVVESLSCTKDIDYVTIMRQSDLMVTDYSSVQFDFAYMRKPVVYYQDLKLPYWRLVDFDYEGDGFGEVCLDADALVEVLIGYVESECALKPAYRERIEEFFIHDDRESGKRLYEADLRLERSERASACIVPGDLSKAAGL